MKHSANNSLTFAMVALLAVRAVLTVVPGTWGWSLAQARFDSSLWAWFAIAALVLVPAVARVLAPAFDRLGRAADAAPAAMLTGLAAGVGLAVFLLDDRTWFTGDFLLRAGVLESRVPLERIAPQSLPLDLALHVHLPRWLAGAGGVADPSTAARALGAIEAALFAALALGVAGGEGHRAAARVVHAAVLLGGATLALFAGYGKSAGEMAIATLAVAAFARRLVTEGRNAVPLGLAMTLALLAHRSGLLLLPAGAAAWILALRGGRAPRGWIAWGLGAALPLIALAVVAPRVVPLLLGFDLPRHLPGAGAAGAAWLSPVAALDRVNVVLAYAPLAPLLLVPIAASRGGRPPASRVLAACTFAPALALLLLVTPQQGLFRDWDVFVVPGVLIALATARSLASRPGAAALAAPVVAAALLGAVSWLAIGHATDAGLARVRAFVTEPPARDPVHVAKVWEFLGDRAAALGRWEEAAVTLREAVVHQPSPRLYLMLSMAEAQAGRFEAAENAAAAAARRDPADGGAWVAWLTLAMQRGDREGAHEAAVGLRRVAPDHPLVRRVLGDSSATGAPVR